MYPAPRDQEQECRRTPASRWSGTPRRATRACSIVQPGLRAVASATNGMISALAAPRGRPRCRRSSAGTASRRRRSRDRRRTRPRARRTAASSPIAPDGSTRRSSCSTRMRPITAQPTPQRERPDAGCLGRIGERRQRQHDDAGTTRQRHQCRRPSAARYRVAHAAQRRRRSPCSRRPGTGTRRRSAKTSRAGTASHATTAGTLRPSERTDAADRGRRRRPRARMPAKPAIANARSPGRQSELQIRSREIASVTMRPRSADLPWHRTAPGMEAGQLARSPLPLERCSAGRAASGRPAPQRGPRATVASRIRTSRNSVWFLT